MNLKIISAGAGSGKTYRLTQEMVSLLANGNVRASGIIATTFTNKAAAELQERVRVKLLEEGLTKEANNLANALIGTVHGLGVKLLKRFAFEAGVSPEVDIIADEDHQLMFNQSLATVLTNERVESMELLSDRLGLNKSAYNTTDWRKVLKDLTEVARSNNFSAAILEKSKERSFESFAGFLDEKIERTPEAWNNQLKVEIEEAITRLENNGDTTKVTATGLKTLKETLTELNLRHQLHWFQWVKLTKVSVGAKSRDDIAPLAEFAAQHLSHADFHNDIKSFLSNIFDISLQAMEEYSRYKKSRGLIDYTDMEALVNQLLDNPLVGECLKEEIDLLLVDEFQDTSPLQLEIFLKLSKLAKHSIWVGDPKQSIYGFRGAEPALMNAIIEKQGGLKKENILEYSWRSREDIVWATNAIFTKAFKEMPVEQVALKPKRCRKAAAGTANKSDEPSDIGKALNHWHFQYDGDGRKPGRGWLDHCIAEQVSTMLQRNPVILPKGETTYRPLLPGDIAILCRSNKSCQDMANALHQAGLKAAISRSGLLNTAEAKLVLACLKFILNKYDSLSIAEILILGSAKSLDEVVNERLDFLKNAAEEISYYRWGNEDPMIQQLNVLRTQVVELSSAELLTFLLEEMELRRIIVSWGNTEQRLANIDVMIKWSFQYEENCNRLHTAASLGGFLLWLNELENKSEDMQGAGENPFAVNVLTYHKSKGLEYPVVICHNLDQPLREDVWGLTIMPESTEIDLDNLLGNRWLRYWFNPYADQFRNTVLAERIDASAAKTKKRKEALEEEARLLYVGITRARDYLVFPTYHNLPTWLNRVYFEGEENHSMLNPNSDISPLEWENNPLAFDIELRLFPADFGFGEVHELPHSTLSLPKGKENHLPYIFDESKPNGNFNMEEIAVSAPFDLPEVIERQLVGRAAVAYVNAEKKLLDDDQRLGLANEIIYRHEVSGLVNAEKFLEIEESYSKWVAASFQIKKLHRQFHLHQHFDGQLFEKCIDLVLETESGIQAIFCSPFVGEKKARLKKGKAISGDMEAVKQSLQQIFVTTSIGIYVHFVLAGVVVKFEG